MRLWNNDDDDDDDDDDAVVPDFCSSAARATADTGQSQ